ncbi:MAG: DUF924 domain-containing protein [Rhodobacteraceae bacterium]|nr:DUF924 domain-containing protein [Paracoccaceae bacterium]
MTTWQQVLKFWFEELTPEQHFRQDDALDAEIRDRFGSLWEQARVGRKDAWLEECRSSLALIVVLDQFPRNMFRGDGRSFASDDKAIEAAGLSIGRKFDVQSPSERRINFYLPYMHSEVLEEQDKCIDLIRTGLGEKGAENLIHAKAHRNIIARFGRFPFRNDALNRQSSAAEVEWLANVGYMGEVEATRKLESD